MDAKQWARLRSSIASLCLGLAGQAPVTWLCESFAPRFATVGPGVTFSFRPPPAAAALS